MDIIVHLALDPSKLARYPPEFNPRVAVFTTDAQQKQNFTPHAATTILPLSREVKADDGSATTLLMTERPVIFSPSHPEQDCPFPNPMEEICVNLFVQTLRTDSSHEHVLHGKPRPDRPLLKEAAEGVRESAFCLGQIHTPLYVLLKDLILSGRSRLRAADQLRRKQLDTLSFEGGPDATTPERVEATSLQVGDAAESPLEELEAREVGSAIEKAIARLRPEYRACIIPRHVEGRSVPSIVLVGGASAFPNMAEVVQDYTRIPTWVPPNPVFITPLGIALHDKLH